MRISTSRFQPHLGAIQLDERCAKGGLRNTDES